MWILNWDVNLVWAVLIFFTAFMMVYNFVIAFGEPYLPEFVLELFRYGKTLNGPAKTTFVKMISVPKSYFTHFYIFSSIYVPASLAAVLYCYHSGQFPELLSQALDFVCTSDREEATTAPRLVLVLALLSLQVFRRLYECLVINQPSNSTMNITHYIVGYAHYFCATTGFVSEAPGFSRSSKTSLPSALPLYCWLLALVFLVAWYLEFEAHKIFAELKIKSPHTHSIPNGSLFNLVSCPHYLCEVIIYSCFMFILGTSHLTGVLVWFWVFTNQLIAATMSHNWYKTKFKEYPQDRCAIIPFIW